MSSPDTANTSPSPKRRKSLHPKQLTCSRHLLMPNHREVLGEGTPFIVQMHIYSIIIVLDIKVPQHIVGHSYVQSEREGYTHTRHCGTISRTILYDGRFQSWLPFAGDR